MSEDQFEHLCTLIASVKDELSFKMATDRLSIRQDFLDLRNEIRIIRNRIFSDLAQPEN